MLNRAKSRVKDLVQLRRKKRKENNKKNSTKKSDTLLTSGAMTTENEDSVEIDSSSTFIINFGNNCQGQLGRKSSSSLSPSILSLPFNATAICAKTWNTCVLADSGDLYFCGWGVHGNSATGTTQDVYSLTQMLFATEKNVPVQQVSCGEAHVIILARDHSVYTVGWCSENQSGIPNLREDTSLFHQVPLNFFVENEEYVVRVCAGYRHSAVLTNLGRVYETDRNHQGFRYIQQLDEGYPNRHYIKTLDATRYVTAMISDTGRLIVSYEGQKSSSFIPEVVETANACGDILFREVVCGREHTVLLTTDNYLIGFGSDWPIAFPLDPVRLPGYRNIKQVAASRGYTLILSECGDIFTFLKPTNISDHFGDCEDGFQVIDEFFGSINWRKVKGVPPNYTPLHIEAGAGHTTILMGRAFPHLLFQTLQKFASGVYANFTDVEIKSVE